MTKPNLVTLDGFEPLKISEEVTLSPQQHAAVAKFIASKATLDEIAKETGYASSSTLCRFLRSAEGQLGLRTLLEASLAQAAATGFRVMLELATDKKTPAVVKQKAAADLMDRGLGLAGEAPVKQPSAGNGVSININLTRRADGSEAIDVTPQKEG